MTASPVEGWSLDYGFFDCGGNQCLHACVPYPQPVTVSEGEAAPVAELYCESNAEGAAEDVCGDCDRTLVLRIERRLPDGGDSQLGEPGRGVTVSYTDAGVWSATGPSVAVVTGYCYRTLAHIELSNGYAAEWATSSETCP